MKTLHISDDLDLPIEAVTQTFAVLAKRGVGKTYTASVMAEEMLKASQQVIAIDPTGAWYGLRSEYPVVIFGGEHADVPLEESAGEVVATAIVENRFPAVIDLSLFRKGQMIRFMTTFAETLYRLNREPVHLFVDEADAVAPQAKNWGGDENRMLGAMEDIVRRGRKRGIGCTLITQRPAVLNKNVLTQCEVLISLRLVHPKDIDAIKEWVNVHADPDQAKEMIASLPSLPVGTAWFWSPGWGDLFKRIKVRARETFDSGATPKPGEAPRKPKKLEPIDVERLGQQIKGTVQRAKENDPKVLKQQLADAQRQLQKLQSAPPAPAEVKTIEKPVVTDAQVKRVEGIVGRLEKEGQRRIEAGEQLRASGEELKTAAREFAVALAKAGGGAASATARASGPLRMTTLPAPAKRPLAPPPVRKHPQDDSGGAGGAEGISKRQQKMLDAAATLETLGVEPTRETVCGWLGIHPRGGSVGQELSALADAGFIAVDRGAIALTDAGRAASNQLDPARAIESAKSGLTPRQTRIFDIVIAAYPESVTREAIAEQMQIHPRGGSFGEDIGRLAGRGLVDSSRGVVRAKDFLFAAAV